MDALPWLAGFCLCSFFVFVNLHTSVVYAAAGWRLSNGFYAVCLGFVCGAWYCFWEFVNVLFRG